jgi:Zn-dependent protease with chaperone function
LASIIRFIGVTEQLRALVPGWVEWLGPLLFVVALAAIIGLVPVVAVRAAARRIDPDDHWTERARNAHAGRVSVVWAVATVPAGIWLLSTITIGPVGWLPSWLFGLAGVTVVVLVAARVGWALEGLVLRQPIPEWRSFLSRFVVRLLPVFGVIALALAAPSRLSSPWMLLWVSAALVVVASLRFQPEWLARFGLAAPAGERLASIVIEAADRAGVEAPLVYVIEHHQPNAFAFPWRGAIAFTSRAVTELTDDELESVALHELGHLAESAATSRVRQAIQFVWIPVAAVKPILGSLGFEGLLAVMAVLLGLLVVVRRFAMRMEARSDEHAVANLDHSETYGRALEKIYRIGLIPAVLRRPSHGQLLDRLEACGLSPDFDPPPAPPVRPLVASTTAAVLVGLAILAAPYLATIGAGFSSPTPAHVALALGSYETWSFERLGQLAEVDGDFEAAEVFYAAAVDVSPEPDALINLVYVRSFSGDCDDAALALSELMERNGSVADLSLAGEWVDWCHQQWSDRS